MRYRIDIHTRIRGGDLLVARAAQRRVILNTDAKNEADDQFAIVHAMLSPTLDVRGLIAAHFGAERSADSQAESRAEIERLLALLRPPGGCPVVDGAAAAIAGERTPA